jgi:hypothetical protein
LDRAHLIGIIAKIGKTDPQYHLISANLMTTVKHRRCR